jgi:RNA polymerase sigma factor (TIGR02999 family)
MAAAADGDPSAAERLLPLVYEELRQAAQRSLANERSGHTLSATALVHEAYLKLAGPRETPWSGRGHFYAAATEAMRRILVDHARARLRVKRGGGAGRRDLNTDIADVEDLAGHDPERILKFDEVFRRLEEYSPEGAAVARLRFYAGLSVEDTAELLALSRSTVDRRWAFARAWLFRQLQESE